MDERNKDHLPDEIPAGSADNTDSAVEIKPDLEKLRTYTQTKLALAEQLRIAREALIALGREKVEQQCGELVVKLAEDRFTLAVLGQFKRGKSSLMNAIIGRDASIGFARLAEQIAHRLRENIVMPATGDVVRQLTVTFVNCSVRPKENTSGILPR